VIRSQEQAMEDKIFLEHYRICTKADDSPQEVSRTGAAINHSAIDIRSNEPVTLQLIPLASIDPAVLEQFKERAQSAQKLDHLNIARLLAVGVEDEYIALVSEHVDGETADSWIVAHGPMTMDAVLRIGIQVVRALAAAAFFSLTHRAIQPSNIMIVPGRTDDGGWPLVKLLNFGLAALESHSESPEASELAPSTAPQFASPEQLQNRPIDFRSEIYSLGATMCFLLTGAVPLVLKRKGARFRARRLPELRRAPKALRNLLGYMLKKDPEQRPQDPVLFEQEIRKCLTKLERRQAIRRKMGMPMAAVIPRPVSKEFSPLATPATQILHGALVFVVLLLMGVAAAAFLLPSGTIPFFHFSRAKIGVPVGVPNAAASASTTSAPLVASTSPAAGQPAPLAENQLPTNGSPAPVASDTSSPAQVASGTLQPNPEPPANQPAASLLPAPVSSNASSPPQIASTTHESQPEPPAKGPDESLPGNATTAGGQPSETSDSASKSGNKAKTVASNSKRTSRSERLYQSNGWPNESNRSAARGRSGSIHGRFLGRTADGRRILRLPSGRVVVVTPGAPDEEVNAPPRHRSIERPDAFVPRPQPFYPPGYTPYD
jgi:serine/threonine protein kinase